VRFFTACLFLVPILSAQDPREIVRRSVELDRKNTEISRNYTYLERQDEREVDGSGKVKNVELRTYDVTKLEGSPYRRLVAINDKPLSPQDQKKEEEKLRKSIEDRKKETPEARERRIAEWYRKQEKQREPLRELPDAFDFRLLREEAMNGGETWVIDATPKPGYKPKAQYAFFLPKVKARFWIDKTDYQWAKVEMETLDTITVGGVLMRLAKGTHLTMEQARINNEVWLPKRIALTGSARLLLLKKLRGRMEFSYSEYKKFQADSRIVSMGQ
jgi:hypothetical protein